MVAKITVSDLKRILLDEVRLLFRRDGSVWKEPILDVIEELKRSNIRTVVFGGTLRSLLVSRLFQGKPGRPRDLDLVVSGIPLSRLEDQFQDILKRRTRFGGLQLQRGSWQLDVWPVSETWGFKHDYSGPADFSELPSTTTFNMEAVAVDVWPNEHRRTVFSGDDQFFEGIVSRTLELNRKDNPFPELTVVRALVMVSELRFKIGPRLATFIASEGTALTDEIFEQVQVKHYGYVRIPGTRLSEFVSIISRTLDGRACQLPALGQLHLWQSDHEPPLPRINIYSAHSVVSRKFTRVPQNRSERIRVD
jgi:hypothetical protein